MKRIVLTRLSAILLFLLCFSSCASDENLFDDNFANDQFQWMQEDGITDGHLYEGSQMSPNQAPSPPGNHTRQQRYPVQQQGYPTQQQRYPTLQQNDPTQQNTYRQGNYLNQYQRGITPNQPQQGSSPQETVGESWIGDSIPMNPDH